MNEVICNVDFEEVPEISWEKIIQKQKTTREYNVTCEMLKKTKIIVT